MIKTRLFPLLVLAAVTAAAILAGCGGGGSSSGGDPATFAPAGSPLYVEATLRPEGELKSNVDEFWNKATGIDTNLGDFIAEKLEESASDEGEEVDFEKEVSPWLGEKAGMSFTEYDGDDFNNYAVAVETTDSEAAQKFIEKQVGEGDEEAEEESYEGNDFYVQEDETAVGVVGDYVVIAEGKKSFEEAVDASSGENLADQDTFSSAIDKVADGSLADVFVDVGGLIEQAGGEVDPESMQIFESSGINPEEATAVASLVPSSDQLEIDISSELGSENAPSGDASKLLGSLPANSFAAVAIPGFGEELGRLIDGIDENGIPGQVPPHKFKEALKQVGVDLDKITGSMGDAAVFAHGRSEETLGGAVVIEMTEANEANNLISSLGLLLRANGTPGVTALSGKATGFSIRSSELGKKPIVVAAKDKRIAIGYGVPDALAGLEEKRPAPLSNTDSFKQAASSLGGTPITAFLDGQSTLKLIEAELDPEDKAEFEEAKPYLQKIGYLAVGSETSGDTAQAKMILGLGE